MKIELEVPDWAIEDRTLYIMSGIELLAYKSPNTNWVMKDGRCSQCGICCTKLNKATNTFVSINAFNGKCLFLTQTEDGRQMCGFGIGRPFGCCIGRDSKEVNEKCTESFMELEC